ncbi:MAG: hypothetical protein IMY72_09485 [Bacteroidetes bacterium]|nr:hypothetical protein [Bacteroidota bacterium]
MKLPSTCHSCNSKLKIKSLNCETFGTTVDGSYEMPILALFNEKEQDFILEFNKKKIKKSIFNPFTHIAGNKVLIIGLLVILASSFLCYLTNTHFDGVINVHYGRPSAYYVFLSEAFINLVTISLILYIIGLLSSKSTIRFIGIIGTQAFARIPLIIMPLIGFSSAITNVSRYFM